MDHQDFALTVITVSVIAGMYLAAGPETVDYVQERWTGEPAAAPGNQGQGFEYGTTHEHALFYVVVNGTELDFSSERYQLNADYVHLEGGRPDVVHKHAKGVRWKDFLETINTSIENRTGSLCIKVGNSSYCGQGRAVLNGEPVDLSAEIRQGDNLAIIIGENASSQVEEYTQKQLPKPYKPGGKRGYRV